MTNYQAVIIMLLTLQSSYIVIMAVTVTPASTMFTIISFSIAISDAHRTIVSYF